MSKRQCPCAGCIAYVPKGLLMCAPHWRMVPKPLQGDINRFYRLMMKHVKALEFSRSLIWRKKYIVAARAAIAAVDQQLMQPEARA